MSLEKTSSGYNDLYFRIILALLAAHTILWFAAKESIFQLWTSWFYYRDMALSFLIAFLLISEVYLATSKLDKKYDWKQYTAERIGLQVTFALVMPCITAFLLAAGYFRIFHLNILETDYIKLDFPVIVILIILLNVYYLAFYFYRQWQLAESKQISVEKPLRKVRETFVVQKGAKNIPLPVETISYFYHDGQYNFLRTKEREDFMVNQPLDEVQKVLPDSLFFRVNRQMIVNFNACQHFEPIEFGKLELIVTPTTKEQIVISQKRAKQFKEWISR
ncbi:LytTr DNA-binding domain-containing protein [Mucilaginibacter gracilis]|uniref:LytTr DNA-binding domain-containing protein n=1 Tax=Mucilaginibacter gracilis TaxID=423350 RepID=A0A495IWH7_9SPHI|nr:LytTR family DNA-binding domain-containing protein [Mucilaginibacter gracilis]RKR80711.1 LytTr DNA-binding domain-containing protein [Mucilaginibacter gracilis]